MSGRFTSRVLLNLVLATSALLYAGCPTVSLPGDGSTPSDDPPSGAGRPPLPPARLIGVQTEGAGRVEQEIVGSFVRLTAVAEPGWRFDGWLDLTRENPLTILPDDSTAITAKFVAISDATTDNGDPDDSGAADDDDDGVADAIDECPNTPGGAAVDHQGCSTGQGDSDSDGVPDAADDCPRTSANVEVDASGCADAQRDTDGDGVPNGRDECPGTAAGTTVLANGCTARQSDGDGDGVPNDMDRCPETPVGGRVDVHGCTPPGPAVCGNRRVETGEQCDPPDGFFCGSNCRFLFDISICGNQILEPDEECDPPNGTTCDVDCTLTAAAPVCGNGVVETGEQCEPPNTSVCNAACQRLTPGNAMCGNGTVETGEECDSTNRAVCGCNCRRIAAAAMCGNCVVQGSEQCDPPDGTQCGSNCLRFGSGGEAVCGNDLVEVGEQCDPPNGTTCDDTCQLAPLRPMNDRCAGAAPITEGTTVFSNIDALKDGVNEAGGDCASSDFGADIWYCLTAPTDARVNVSLCGSSYDTMLAVYEGCGCPTAPAFACDDDGCTDGLRSDLTFAVEEGRSYMVRVGGYRGAIGRGAVTVTYRPMNDSCASLRPISDGMTDFTNIDATMDGDNEISGGCRSGDFDTDIWYCHRASCTGTLTVSVCDSSFDTMLAVYRGCGCPSLRAAACNNNSTECDSGITSRLSVESAFQQEFLVRIGGLDGAQGEGTVEISCELGNTCGPGNGDCFSAHSNPGCNDPRCCEAVCAVRGALSCCTETWDEECVFLASRLHNSCEP